MEQELPTDDTRRPIGVAILGAGYWGPNLLRNFCANPAAEVRAVCDLDVDRARAVVGAYSTIRVTSSLDEVLDDPLVRAVVVATPAGTHAPLALAALRAGRHVLVEKPLASTVEEGRRVVELAVERGLVLMCDHTYCYAPAVQTIRRLVHEGALGELQYVDSVRINLGLIRPDADVLWDLAPHDLAILDYILPPQLRPSGVAAHGVDPVGVGQACVGHLALPLGGAALAHLHVNWLSPTKIRTMIVAGSRRMVVWDDLQPAQRLTIYDSGVDLTEATDDEQRAVRIGYRTGTIVAPPLPEREALAAVVEEFLGTVRQRRIPATDGASGLRVLELLELAEVSMGLDGLLMTRSDAAERTVA